MFTQRQFSFNRSLPPVLHLKLEHLSDSELAPLEKKLIESPATKLKTPLFKDSTKSLLSHRKNSISNSPQIRTDSKSLYQRA